MVHLPGGLNANVALLNYAKWIREVCAFIAPCVRFKYRFVYTQRTIECRTSLPPGSRFDHGRVFRDE